MPKCNCFDETLEEAKEHIISKIPDGSIDIDIGWQGYAFYMTGDYSPVNPRVNIEYRLPKNGGGHRKNLTKNSLTIVADYCPFCGRKLAKSVSHG